MVVGTRLFIISLFISTQVDAQEMLHSSMPIEFTPSEVELIGQFEGFPVAPIQAQSVWGNPIDIATGFGKSRLLVFWNRNSHVVKDIIPVLNRLNGIQELEVILLTDETKIEVLSLIDELKIKFEIIPNAEIFGTKAYGIELGYPRAFYVDADGIIRKVFPQKVLIHDDDIFQLVTKEIQLWK